MPNLNTSLKTPFISVFNKAGRNIANNFGRGEIIVTGFRYKYDDEDDDICTIKMQMANPQALDLLNITRGTELRVVWGYLENMKSPVATVVVRDMTSKYGPNIIYTDLECTDYLTYLKIFRSSDSESSSVIDYINTLRYGKYNIKIMDRGITLYYQYKRDKKKDQEEQQISYLTDPPEGEPAPFVQEFIHLPDNKITPGEWAEDISSEHPVRAYLEKPDISIPTSNRSQYVVIQDILKKCPNGPWFVTGRGNWLLIHNRNLGGKVNRSYRYLDEPAQLLDFQAKTKFENFERQSISYAGMDARDRKNFYIDDYRKAIMNQRPVKEILDDKKITDDKKKEELTNFVDLYEGGYQRFAIQSLRGAFMNPGTERQYFLPGPFEGPVLKTQVDGYAVRDQTDHAYDQVAPGIQQPPNTGKTTIDEIILRASWFTVPLLTYEEAVAVTNNRERELAQQKEEGKMTVEGDPFLQDQQRVAIDNVHSQHEGIYYVKKCEHIITAQGYKTQLDCLKVMVDATIDTIGTVTGEIYSDEELDEEILEVYKREQMLYGTDVVVSGYKYEGKRHYVMEAADPADPTYNKYNKADVRFSDLYNGEYSYTTDTWVDEMVEVNNSADSKVTNIELDPEGK